jgi:hypothetical protein
MASEAPCVSPAQFRARVVEPALGKLGLPGGEAAIRLVLGTAVQESALRYLQQEKGPALGFFQIEPGALADLYNNFLNFRRELRAGLDEMLAPWPSRAEQLSCTLRYAAAVCRLIYYRASDPLPAADDIDGLGRYWKRFYNTDAGAGSVAEFVRNYRRFIPGR